LNCDRRAQRRAILTNRNGLKKGISTICSGFWGDRLYGQLRSVKNYFRKKHGSGEFGRASRVMGIGTVVHIGELSRRLWMRKAE
jgi:hypothetical protein